MTLEEYREQYCKDLRHEVDKLSNEYEAQLKAKDEEIERLKADCEVRLDTWRSKIWNMPYYAEIKKARSIVAMLFWEWKATKDCTDDEIVVSFSEDVFLKAYKMLKEQ